MFTRIANSYSGITCNTSLDQNGDRKYGDYEYWVVRGDKNNAALHIWKPTGRFVYEKKVQMVIDNHNILVLNTAVLEDDDTSY